MNLSIIKGLSDKRIAELQKLGINSVEELVKHFPKNYLDLRKALPLRQAIHNDFALVKARIVGKPTLTKKGRLSFVKALACQDEELFNIVWFNQPYVLSKLTENASFLFYGRIKNRFGQVSMTNPTFELIEENNNLKGIVPVYRTKGNLSQKVMRSIINDALNKVSISSVIPNDALIGSEVLSLQDAYRMVHNPKSFADKDSASERIALEEYFILISAFKIIKGDKEQVRVNKYNVSSLDLREFVKRFGFEFTDGQKKAVNEIFYDLLGPKVMNRILQGDVGSGKTAVSMCSIFIAAASGFQSVMISPTEVLAKQNFEILKRVFPEYKIVFLSGSIPTKEKTAIKKQIASGEAQIVCGTHAVIEKDVVFNNLSLCVCDEQQRFGVSQRAELVGKGNACDVLVMSATPIPRTFSLIFYGDLDISIISDKPKSRAEIKTWIIPNSKFDDMLQFILKEINSGRQAFFVCPMIDGDLDGTMMSVSEIFDSLSAKLPTIRLKMLHGKMKDAEKTEIMVDFKARKIDALVSTTVIEVGIDVPNATIMVIFGADRFGLSQLHQLRGRVGRGELLSYCFLLTDNESEKTVERLNVIKQFNDGFKISECDFQERGSGDFLGTRQSGKMMSELGDLKYSSSTIFLAKHISDLAFSQANNFQVLRKLAIEKYNKLKDVTLN